MRYRKPHFFKKRKPLYRYLFFRLTILILIFLSLLIYFLFFTDYFQIKKINLTNAASTDEQQFSQKDLLAAIQNKTENKILFLNSHSIFLFRINQTEKEILHEFPQLEKIEIQRQFPDTLNILIIPRKELAVFCLVDNCYLLDKEGIIFNPTGEANSLLKIIDTRNETRPQLGEKVIGEQELDYFLKIKSQLEQDFNILINRFILSSEKLTVVTQDGWEIYFDLKNNMDWQLTKLKILLQEKITPKQRANLEYIELRFGNFANPKYRLNQDNK
ncbi:MAG: cell division protein FtsQ/DivIB [Minisyncoccales bacterium]